MPKIDQKTEKSKRNSIFESVVETLERLGHNPIEALTLIAQDMSVDTDLRLRANVKLADKYKADMKAISHTFDTEEQTLAIAQLKKEMETLLKAHTKSF